MKLAVILAALAGAACGGDRSGTADVTGHDTIDGAAGDASPDTLAPAPVITALAPTAPVGAPFFVALAADAPLTATVTLSIAGQTHAVKLYRGRGSVALRVDAPGTYPVALDGVGAGTVTVAERPQRPLSGALAGDDLAWSAAADVSVTGDVTVPLGATLTIGAGTRVLLAERASVEVAGAIRAEGTAAGPILLTAAGTSWGGLRLLPGADGDLAETWLVAGGGDAARAFGHSGSQPVVWVDAARLVMQGGGVLDGPGKAFGARNAELTLADVRIARCDTGGELVDTALVADRLHVSEIPDGDGVSDDDDNDGIYLRGARMVAGEAVESLLRDCVFAAGEDDGIDHNEALVRVERAWIEGFAHEGVAASVGRRISVIDSVIRGCEQGIEAGYGAPEVVVERTTVTGNGAGLRFGDSYDWADEGTLTATDSVIWGNDVDVRNFARGLGGPKPGAVTIGCSVIGDAEWVGVAGNVAGPPEGAWAAGCAAGPALALTQCTSETPGPNCPFAQD